MKPIIEKENQETILTSKITNNHIVVGIIDGEPVILYCSTYDDLSTLSFLCLDDESTIGNSYRHYGCDSVKEIVEFCLSCDNKIEVFHQKDWKKALQWLIDNA